ncbi:MAG: hypothetical protein OXG78_08185 [Chloroflexi bacterium]|nr:hypothetical protein [Chloroflexota bacterium]
MSEKIALGFCNNVDYEIVWSAKVLEDRARYYEIRARELGTAIRINCERDLVISILSFMEIAAGGERFVADSALIEDFARQFDKKITLGGTSVRAAIAMRKLGYTSALHLITQNDHVRRLIPADSPYVCSNERDSTYPHLIMQYPKDARIRAGDINIRARQPNRLIYHCNADRIVLKLNEDFADLITSAKVLLISGFNAIQSERVLADRLRTVGRMIEALPADATVFLEDGAYFDPGFRQLIFQALGRRIGILSLNEDELQTNLKRKVDLRDVAQVRAALADLHRQLPVRTLVVHMRDWALAYGDDAGRYGTALKAGATMATARFRYGDDFKAEDYHNIAQTAPLSRNAAFADAMNATSGGRVICVPVAAVEQSNATTIGLGDAFVGGFLPAWLA